jgi:hypothetical protein
MQYSAMTSANAKIYLERLRAGDEIDVGKFIESRGQGSQYPENLIITLHEKLISLKESLKGERYEAEASAIVHKELQASPQVFSDPDFWTWMSVKHFYHLIEWRHPANKEGKFNLKNFGVGGISDNFLYRMWVRADIALDEKHESGDPYFYAKKDGGQDFYVSFIVRRRYANIRNVGQAFIKFYFETYKDIATKKLLTKADGNQQLYRLLGKSIQRLGANILFECMNFDQACNIIKQEAEKLIEQSKILEQAITND